MFRVGFEFIVIVCEFNILKIGLLLISFEKIIELMGVISYEEKG